MKKIIIGFLLILLTCFYNNVYAEDYNVKEIIPVGTKASVQADLFIYYDINYYPAVNNNGLGLFTFRSIQNLSNKRVPISIDILLFDENKKNIGFLTYCSEKDIDSDYANFKIDPLKNHVFAINVTTKYFVDDKTPLDTKYYAIFDDNPYCKIGGYGRYKGMTMDEILKTLEAENVGNSNKITDIINSFFKSNWAKIILFVILGIIVLSITGNVLNKLYYQLYKTNTNLVYLPFVNYYISMKLAFGGIIALGFAVFMLIAILLWIFKIGFLMVVVHIVGIISFIIVIFKLVTKNYDMLFFEPKIDINKNNDDNDKKFFNNDSDNEILDDDNFEIGRNDKKEMRKREKQILKEKKRKEKEKEKESDESNKKISSVLDLDDFSDNFGEDVKKTDNNVSAIEELELKYDNDTNTNIDLNLDDSDDDDNN